MRHPTSMIGRLIRGSISTKTAVVRVHLASTKHAGVRIVSGNGKVSRASTQVSFRHRTASGVGGPTSLFTLRAFNFHNRTLTSVTTITRMRIHAHERRSRLNAIVRVTKSGLRSRRLRVYPINAGFRIGGLFFGIPTEHGFLGSSRARVGGMLTRVRHITLIRPRVTFSMCHGSIRLVGIPRTASHRHVRRLFNGGLKRRLLSVSISAALIGIANYMNIPRDTHGGNTRYFFFIGNHCVHRPCFRGTIVRTCTRLVPTTRRMPCFLCLAISPSHVSIGVRPAGGRVGFRSRRTV